MEVIDQLWLCSDCAIVAANDDRSGLSEDQIEATDKGLNRLGAHLACDGEEREFSRIACDCCLSRLYGNRMKFVILGEEKPRNPQKELIEETLNDISDALDQCNEGLERANKILFRADLNLDGIEEMKKFIRWAFKDLEEKRLDAENLWID